MAETAVDVADVGDLVAARLPGYRVEKVVPLGEGQENAAYEVNGELVVRFAKEPDPARRAAQVRWEDTLLGAVAALSPLPVPQVRFTAPERGCLAYRKVPGTPLLDLPAPARLAHGPAIAAVLGDLLAALHAAPVESMADLVDVDDQPLPEWQADARGQYADLADRVPREHRGAVEAFLAEPPPDGGHSLVFSHNDLGIEHVLVDPGADGDSLTVTGIIDWGDAALDDPAYDFGLILRDLGPRALDAALDRYGRTVPGLVARAAFYARCSVLEDLAYGIESGRQVYATKSLASMEWLFRG